MLDSARTLKSLPELSAAPLLQPNGQGWLKSAAQMLQLGKEIIHAAGYGTADLKRLLAQTEALADRCRMDPVTDMGWKQPVVPEASVIGIDGDPLAELTLRCEAGIGRRFPGNFRAARNSSCGTGWSTSCGSSTAWASPPTS